MRVGICLFGADGGRSGISRYILQLLAELARTRPDAELELVGFESERELFLPEGVSWSFIGYGDWLRHPVVNLVWHQIVLPVLCHLRGWDVVFIPAGNRRLPAWVPCPVVGTVHDFASLRVEGKYDAWRGFYIAKLLPALVRRLDRVITVSESSRADILDITGVAPSRVDVIPLGVDGSRYRRRSANPAALSKYGIRTPFVLYVSRIESPGKNHIRLIRAFDRVKVPHQLVIAGSDWTRAADVHAEADKARCREDIRFTGFVPDEDLAALYSAADAFVFPSLYEGFGLPILEAMASGIPVACSNTSSMPEVAGGAALLFDPYSQDQIESILAALLGDEKQRSRLVAAGRARATTFRWSAVASRTWSVLEQATYRKSDAGELASRQAVDAQ